MQGCRGYEYHMHIHRFFVDIHGYIHIHRCLSCVNVYPLNNYKAQLVSTVYCQYLKENKKIN